MLIVSKWLARVARASVKVVDGLSASFNVVSAILIISCSIVVVYDIVARMSGHPTNWGYDLTIYIMVGFVFLCLSQGLKSGAHIKIDLITQRMNQSMQDLMEIIGFFIILVFSSIFSRYTLLWAINSILMGDKSSGMMRVVLWPSKLLIAISIIILSLMALRLLITKCHSFYQARTQLHFGTGLNNPWFTIPVFVGLIVVGIVLLKSNPIIGVLVLLLTLLGSGTPIAFSMGTVALAVFFLALGGEKSLLSSPQIPYDFVTNYTLVALPLFIFAGNIMAKGGLGKDLFSLASVYFGHFPGGLAVATVVACAFFGAVSGSSAANALTIGAIAYPALVSYGYSKRMAAGLIATSSGLGILIPPSNSFITYGILTDESIGQLFMAGLIPGIMLALMLAIAVVIVSKRTGHWRPFPKASWKERLLTTKNCFAVILMPVVVIGGIYSGVFTVTEAAGAAVAYALIYSLVARRLKFKDLLEIVLVECTRSIAFLMMIIVCARMLAISVTMLQVPELLGTALTNASIPGWGMIIIFMAFGIFLGMFLDGISITMLIVPIITPILLAAGYNLIWFGVLLTINCEIGQVTPPVGLNVFIMQHVTKLESADVFRGIIIFGFVVLLALIICGVFPPLSLWLPNKMIQ